MCDTSLMPGARPRIWAPAWKELSDTWLLRHYPFIPPANVDRPPAPGQALFYARKAVEGEQIGSVPALLKLAFYCTGPDPGEEAGRRSGERPCDPGRPRKAVEAADVGRGQEILPIGGHLSRDLKEVGTEAMGKSSQRAAVRRLGEDAVRGGARADWHRVRGDSPMPSDGGHLVMGVEDGATGIQPGRCWAGAKCGRSGPELVGKGKHIRARHPSENTLEPRECFPPKPTPALQVGTPCRPGQGGVPTGKTGFPPTCL